MKRILMLAVAVFALAGCETLGKFQSGRYATNNNLGRAWLSDQILPPEVDVSGNWRSEIWGRTFLAQNGSEVRGNLGDYPVEGVVSGRKAYLLASQGGWYYYSIILEMPAPNILIGYYSRGVPYKTSGRVDLRLDRM